MIRTETHTLDATTDGGVKRRLAGVYGFVAHRLAAAAVFPLVAWVKYEGEYTERYIVVREGVPVLGTRRMLSVRLALVAGAGDVYVTSADELGDVLGAVPSASAPVVLYDAVGPVNAPHTTGALDVSALAALLVEESPVGGAAAASVLYLRDLDNPSQTVVAAAATTVDANPNLVGWGVGVGAAGALGYYKGGIPAPLPARVSFEVGALGAGISARLRVLGRGA